MERKPDNGLMEQSSTQKQFQYNSMDPRNEEFQSASQLFMQDPLSGEEFALEFMRDRVNPRKPLLPNIDLNCATGYMELKGILGIRGSESGSDISMLNTVEKGQKDFERKNSFLHEDRSNYGSFQSEPRTLSGYDSSRGVVHGYASSGASDSLSTKMKVLCSSGGKILPRPSDGKLRYVGGETRIIRIRKDISWQELMQKTSSIYNQDHVIKYQLPGEDLDALVSVSCDEDLLNMMEECNELVDREGAQKLRIFLFSMSDLDDAQFGLGSVDGDSEVQFMVAVNGMDMGSRKNSTLHGLVSSSANNLNMLNGQESERESRFVTDSIGVNSSSAFQSSQPILPSSSDAYETYPQVYHGQMMHHGESRQYPLHHGLDPVHHAPFGAIPPLVPLHGVMNQQGGLTEGLPYGGLRVQNLEMAAKQVKPKCDVTVQQKIDTQKICSSEKDYTVPSQPHDANLIGNVPVEEAGATIAAPDGDLPLLSSKNEGKHQEPENVSSSVDAVNSMQEPKSSDDEHYSTSSSAFAPGYADSESSAIDLNYLEPPVPPQRFYYSERIPREQAELLNRLSKSDDSHGSQFLISNSRSNTAQQDSITECVDKLRDGNPDPQIEQSTSTSKQLFTDTHTIDDGLAQLQKYKEFADELCQMNSKLPQDVDYGHEKPLADEPAEAGSELPAVSQVASFKHHEDIASNLLEPHWSEASGKGSSNDDTKGHAQPFSWMERSAEDVSKEIPMGGESAPVQGDILIDIEDRFSRDFLSDIFSKAIISEVSPGISPLHKDGAGLSINMENHEPKRWSYFQKLAQEGFVQKDVSLMDQDHFAFSSAIGKVEGVLDSQSQPNFGEDNQKELRGILGANNNVLHPNYDHSQVKGTENMQFDVMMENLRMPESEYEEGKLESGNSLLPPPNPSLEDFDISTLQIIKNEDLEELRELGSGTFGTVYHGKWRGTDVAIKRIKKSCFTGRSSEQERLTIEFWREADILSKLHHPNVVAFYGVVQDGPGGTLATVAEFMVDGSLRHVLLRKDRFLDRRKRLIIAMDAAFGMEYLHSKNIVHFDLKCDNLLVNLKDPLRPICKVGDFGLSKIKRNTLVSGGVRGTLPWMAPELLNGSSNKVDVFSFGIVLWEILTGEEPYANMHYGAIIGGIVNNTLRPTIPSYCDPEWRILMEQCWAPNPATRPSFTEIASRLRVMSTAANQAKSHGQKSSK
uniref:Protein kinase domain-containing protein n=1 Tax=Fagus sylvatica TaxID=28930 RepID=A0A2N9ELH7_FAGSY